MIFQVYHWLGLIRHQLLDSRPPRDFPPPSNSHPKLITYPLLTFGKNVLPMQAHYSKNSALLFPTLGLTKENSCHVSTFMNTAEVPASPRSKAFPNPTTLPSAISMPSRWVSQATKPDVWDVGHCSLPLARY